jgi:hypothetical protein
MVGEGMTAPLIVAMPGNELSKNGRFCADSIADECILERDASSKRRRLQINFLIEIHPGFWGPSLERQALVFRRVHSGATKMETRDASLAQARKLGQ